MPSTSIDIVAFSILINPTLTNTTADSISNSSSRLSLRFSSSGSSSSGSNPNLRASTSQGSLMELSISKKPIESQLEWIGWLKKAFLGFVEKKVHKSMEMELKILFLEHFLNPLTEKVAWKTRSEVLSMLNLFCELVLEWMVPFEWIEIEKTKDVKNLNYYTQQLALILEKANLFEHEYLKDFIHNQAKLTSSSSMQEEIEESETIDEVKLICSMFFLELSDWFNEFEFTNRKKINKWFAKGLQSDIIPKYVIKIYKTKRDKLSKANEEFIFKEDDLNQKHVIASDWNYTNFIGKEHSTEWTLTYSRCPETSMWISSVDRSSDKLGLKTLKSVGYLDTSVAKITKATCSDAHFHQFFKEARFHDYSSIDKSHSQKKYPLVFMSNIFKFGPMFSTRELHLVYSTLAKFQSDKMVESCILFKSRDYVYVSKDVLKANTNVIGFE
ncbi:predicted protein [Naegleria gruberi]|uniref:Predicted protein n=1 Tax=Naegleria gruberi TaxID=5762 RepID=D2VQP2_NAEGR|nr:uncharacterized protein NAEGRDRAFT_51498 [Naegleria gruberi]EFC40906.1 predicted protein [Naegleria gruberi]|eukprot:XP_002673650.1 predicted protein [Naegleria gruberi strain NEG-M]